MRITIPKTVYAKLQTQLAKDKNAVCKKLLADTKVTITPKGDALLWDPSGETTAAIANVLENEQGFMRKKEAVTYTSMTDTIKRLRANLPPLDVK